MRARLVLVVENDALVAMGVEAEVALAGHAVVGSFGSGADALAWLRDHPVPDAAVIDLLLRDGPCVEFAGHLRRRGVPFLIHSGAIVGSKMSADLAGVPVVEKPAPSGQLAAALDRLLAGAALAA